MQTRKKRYGCSETLKRSENLRLFLALGSGMLLAISASLKFYGIVSSHDAYALGTAAAWLTWFAIPVELAGASLLLLFPRSNYAWLSGLLLFIGLGLTALSFWAVGVQTCSCLGPLHTHPGVMAVVDGALASAFWILRPPCGSFSLLALLRSTRTALGSHIAALSSAIAITVLVAVLAWYALKSSVQPHRAIVTADQRVTLGAAAAGDVRQVAVSIKNTSDDSVRIIGGGASCHCITLIRFPVDIQPGGDASLPLKVQFGRAVGPFCHRVRYILDAPEQPAVTVSVCGRVLE